MYIQCTNIREQSVHIQTFNPASRVRSFYPDFLSRLPIQCPESSLFIQTFNPGVEKHSKRLSIPDVSVLTVSVDTLCSLRDAADSFLKYPQ